MQGTLSKETVNVVGTTGKLEKQTFFNLINFKFGKQWLTHQFLYMPECPIPLLGRDLLSKLGAQIIKGKKYNYWYQRLKPLSQGLLGCRENQNQKILKEY